LRDRPGETRHRAKGPEHLWKFVSPGNGYSSVAAVGDRLYSAGGNGGQVVVTALSTDGKKLWAPPIGPTGGGGYTGPRSTPTVDGDHLYILGDEGDLACPRVVNFAQPDVVRPPQRRPKPQRVSRTRRAAHWPDSTGRDQLGVPTSSSRCVWPEPCLSLRLGLPGAFA
jgi:outer membrane protein assembly factor BamB